MRLLTRNTTTVYYKPYLRASERMPDGRHTGDFEPKYGDPIPYRGTMSAASGQATANLFGFSIPYTHTLLLEGAETGITEDGLIEWKGAEYEIKAIAPSLNFTRFALRKRTVNHARG